MSPPTAQREPTRLRRTYVYRLKPTAAQERALQAYLDVTRELYNAALEQRIWARRIGARQPNQSAQLPELRASHLDGFNAQVLQQVLRRLDRAYDGFFRRCASGAARKGFPRFRSARRWRSFTFPQFPSGCALADGRLRIQNVGAVRIHQHRLLAGIPKTCAIVRKADGWYAHISCDLGDAPALRGGDRTVGVDLGLFAYATLSDGENIANPRHLRCAEKKLLAEQRALSRKKRGSARRDKQRQRLALAHLKVARARRDFHFKLALDLVRRFDRIAVENLAVAAMLVDGRSRSRGLNRSVGDAGWAQFLSILADKAEEHGVELVRVDPRGTTQDCSTCGAVAPKTLRDRRHICGCGADLDRDVNAAINIKNRAWVAPVAEAA